jgi:hypothetical protein
MIHHFNFEIGSSKKYLSKIHEEVDMNCPYFEPLSNIGICKASNSDYIPGTDQMGRLCFKDTAVEEAINIAKRCGSRILALSSIRSNDELEKARHGHADKF